MKFNLLFNFFLIYIYITEKNNNIMNMLNKNICKISLVTKAHATLEGAGFLVHRSVGSKNVEEVDPFLMLDEMGPMNLKPGEAKGAPWHPHRGFQTVTYMLKGEMEHKDSMGNSGFLRSGDIQWMIAGSGVIHDELPSKDMVEKGGMMHGFQLWVNLPKNQKMCDPNYQDIPSHKIPTVSLDKDGKIVEHNAVTNVKVIAGNSFNVNGPVQTFSVPIQFLDFKMGPNSTVEYTFPEKFNSFAYIYEGSGSFYDGESNIIKVNRGEIVVFDCKEKNTFKAITSTEAMKFLFLAGKPIQEPIARYGPFVMNTEEEIMQAFMDYQNGKFVKKKGTMLSQTNHKTSYEPDK